MDLGLSFLMLNLPIQSLLLCCSQESTILSNLYQLIKWGLAADSSLLAPRKKHNSRIFTAAPSTLAPALSFLSCAITRQEIGTYSRRSLIQLFQSQRSNHLIQCIQQKSLEITNIMIYSLDFDKH